MSNATNKEPQFYATTENGQPCVKDRKNPGFHSPFISQFHATVSAERMNENEALAAGFFWMISKP